MALQITCPHLAMRQMAEDYAFPLATDNLQRGFNRNIIFFGHRVLLKVMLWVLFSTYST
ncbi:hypothetical protein D3C80_1756130 [compost metagenome]